MLNQGDCMTPHVLVAFTISTAQSQTTAQRIQLRQTAQAQMRLAPFGLGDPGNVTFGSANGDPL